MKFQKIVWNDPDSGTCVRWAASQDAAGKLRAEIRRNSMQGVINFTTETIEVPTDKNGLVAFLNANADRMNG